MCDCVALLELSVICELLKRPDMFHHGYVQFCKDVRLGGTLRVGLSLPQASPKVFCSN